MIKNLRPLILPMIVVIIWQAVTAMALVDRLLLPEPLSVLGDVFHILGTASGWLNIGATLGRTLLGFILGFMLGVVLGFLLAQNSNVWASSEFLIDFLRSLPVTALIPLFFLFFGPGEIARLATVVYVVSLIVLLSVRNGIVSIDSAKKEVIALYEFPRVRLLQVYTYESAPHIITASRLALSISLLVVIVSEMFFTADFGLGSLILESQFRFNSSGMFAAIIICGLMGYGINQAYIKFMKTRGARFGVAGGIDD